MPALEGRPSIVSAAQGLTPALASFDVVWQTINDTYYDPKFGGLDWNAVRALPYEARISRLAAWVDLAEREGRRYRLRLPGQPQLGPGRGLEHHHACLRALALLPDA